MAVSRDERESANSSEKLAEALEPVVEHSVRLSIRNDPRVLAGVLFPVIGPAIRKAVSATLSDMVESLSRILENSFSTQALRWRFQAWRTGRPFAEIALLHSLVYRVEQVLLIHRPSGLLLAQVQAPSVRAEDNLLVSGMLSAIQDFVHESFSPRAEAPLRTMDAGELTVWLEQGPNAILAAVIRGAPPPELRQRLGVALETLHQRHATDLEILKGDTAVFDRCRPVLEDCLAAQYRPRPQPARRPVWVIAGILAVLAAIWIFYSVSASREWARTLDRLRAEPGIVVVSESRSGGRYRVAGLRDPLAADPRRVLAQAGVDPAKIDGVWRAFYSLDSAIVERRARKLLQPPEGVTLAAVDGSLEMRGTAPHFWISGAIKSALSIPGVERVRIAGLQDMEMDASRQALESAVIRFAEGSAALTAEETDRVRRTAAVAAGLEAAGRGIGRSTWITVIGRADGAPSPRNPELAMQRAERVLGLLIGNGVSASVLKLGSAVEAPERGAEWRSVTFEVALGDGAEAGAR